jgi:hypothetical protein
MLGSNEFLAKFALGKLPTEFTNRDLVTLENKVSKTIYLLRVGELLIHSRYSQPNEAESANSCLRRAPQTRGSLSRFKDKEQWKTTCRASMAKPCSVKSPD